MRRISSDGSSPDNKFIDCNSEGGQKGTLILSNWLNAIQEELGAILESNNISLNSNLNNQIATYLNNRFSNIEKKLNEYKDISVNELRDFKNNYKETMRKLGIAEASLSKYIEYQKDYDYRLYQFLQHDSSTRKNASGAFGALFEFGDYISLSLVGCIFIAAFPKSEKPKCWDGHMMLCDGSVLKISEYPELYSLIKDIYSLKEDKNKGEFRIPDYRGLFLRGTNYERNDNFRDSSVRLNINGDIYNHVGSIQHSMIESHYHGAGGSKSNWGGMRGLKIGVPKISASRSYTEFDKLNDGEIKVWLEAENVDADFWESGQETRPKNIAVDHYICVKSFYKKEDFEKYSNYFNTQMKYCDEFLKHIESIKKYKI